MRALLPGDPHVVFHGTRCPRELEAVVLEAIQRIGARKVVCIDNTHPDVRARAGINAMAVSGSVPIIF